jgi:hypothetical protein
MEQKILALTIPATIRSDDWAKYAALEWLAYHRADVLATLRAYQYGPVERVSV